MTVLNQALEYAKNGFFVIPIRSETKTPLIKFANEPALSENDIYYYFGKMQVQNMALRTVNHFVVDIDNHNGVNGLNSLKEHMPQYEAWFKDTYAETTKNGGYHYYFTKPTGTAVKQHIKILPGVDIKAHVNNYTLIAPSPGYTALNHLPMKPAPTEFIEWLKETETAPQAKGYKFKFDRIFLQKSDIANYWERLADDPTDTNLYLFFNRGKAPHYLEIYKNGLGNEGQRNDLLTSFVGYLVAINVNYDKVYQLALIANDHTTPPLPINEVNNTVLSIIRRDAEKWNKQM